MDFFQEKRAAAVLKHGLLRRYLHLFASKTGKHSQRVAYVDAYAGPGVYDDGSPGSPLLAARTAKELVKIRNVEGYYFEEDAETCNALRTTLAPFKAEHPHQIFNTTLEEHLEEVLAEATGLPMLVFIDPFGLPVAMDVLFRILARGQFVGGRRTGPATEVILNFSYPGLRRTAGQLGGEITTTAYAKARASILGRLDAVLGGEWWRPIWEAGGEDREDTIADAYRDKLMASSLVRGWYKVPVANKWKERPLYDLVLLTQYPQQGLWYFGECASLAFKDFYEFNLQGQLDLGGYASLETQWVNEIKRNAETLLAARPAFTVQEVSRDLCGSSWGYARETHIRTAIKELFREGKTTTAGTGDVRAMRVVRRPH